MANAKLGINEQAKTIINAARLVKSGGESIDQIIGQISISLDRLAKLKERKEEKTQYEWSKKEIGQLIEKLFEKTDKYIKIIYDNQEKERRNIIIRYSIIAGAILLGFYILSLLFQCFNK